MAFSKHTEYKQMILMVGVDDMIKQNMTDSDNRCQVKWLYGWIM